MSTDTGGTLVVLVGGSALTGERATGSFLLEELLVGEGGEGGSLVNDRSLVDLLVDGGGLVDNGRLDRLALDDGLDGLVDVVVLMSVDVGADVSSGALGVKDVGGVLVEVALLGELGLVLGKHVLLVLADGSLRDSVDVLSGEDILVGDGLNAVLVVDDVTFTVDSLGGLNALLVVDGLLDNLGGNLSLDLVDQHVQW